MTSSNGTKPIFLWCEVVDRAINLCSFLLHLLCDLSYLSTPVLLLPVSRRALTTSLPLWPRLSCTGFRATARTSCALPGSTRTRAGHQPGCTRSCSSAGALQHWYGWVWTPCLCGPACTVSWDRYHHHCRVWQSRQTAPYQQRQQEEELEWAWGLPGGRWGWWPTQVWRRDPSLGCSPC